MTAQAGPDEPVVVVGGGLAGMAAAARLAKVGHRVRLLEATDSLGGSWAPYEFEGVLVDRAPGVLGFPAPWRDLFRKSGRPLEAELARTGLALEPGPPTDYEFADGTRLSLPAERGQQHEVLSDVYGEPVALRWRRLVDDLDGVWQAVRPLGLEAELTDRRQLRAARSVLTPRRTIADLAAELREPHLAAVVTSIAHRLGSLPDRTPAWCAVELWVQRTFGRWVVGSETVGDRAGRSSVLVETLAARLALRHVEVVPGQRVVRLLTSGERVTGVLTGGGQRIPAAAVVVTVDPWQLYGELWPTPPGRALRRAVSTWSPARAPAVSHSLAPGRTGDPVTETVTLTADGVPTVRYARPTAAGTLTSVHDHRLARPTRSAGIAWDGFASWARRPRVRGDLPGLFTAGPASPGGGTPSAVVLSGALASYACHDYLT